MDKKDFYEFEVKASVLWKIIGFFVVSCVVLIWLPFLCMTIEGFKNGEAMGLIFVPWVWCFFCIDYRMADLFYSRIKIDKRNRTIEIRRLFRFKKVISVDNIKRWRRVSVRSRGGYTTECIYMYYGNSKLLLNEVYKDYVRFSCFIQQYAGNKCVMRTSFQNMLDDMRYFLTIN
ncbi:MAG: hypothetical protein J5802_06870 [Butyrivibrio sp.]|nr:hypothetical protein [Butyrivibrio sp.]